MHRKPYNSMMAETILSTLIQQIRSEQSYHLDLTLIMSQYEYIVSDRLMVIPISVC